MKKMATKRILFGGIIYLFLLLGNGPNARSQDIDYTIERFVKDVLSQQYEEPIKYGGGILSAIEKVDANQFSDTVYIEIAGLLSLAYMGTSQLHLSDSIISHAVSFLESSNISSKYTYTLYMTLGIQYNLLQNHSIAADKFAEALKIMELSDSNVEDYAVVLSLLSLCHRELGDLEKSKKEMQKALALTKNTNMSKVRYAPILQKAGALYYDLGIEDTAISYTKQAYELSRGEDQLWNTYYYCAQNLSSIYTDHGEYAKSLDILHQLERELRPEEEKAGLYNGIFLNYYFLNQESLAVKYAELCSKSIIERCYYYYYNLPVRETEYLWRKDAIQLSVNNGILDKFPNNPSVVGMCYNNILFQRSLSIEHSLLYEKLSQEVNAQNTFNKIKEIRTDIFSDGCDSLISELEKYEKELLDQVRGQISLYRSDALTWRDVQKSLKMGECAIEIIPYVGFPSMNEEDIVLWYGALIVLPGNDTPVFERLCTVEQLENLFIAAYSEKELGINSLYGKGMGDTLYNYIWRNIDKHLKDKNKVYVSSGWRLRQINIGAIPNIDGVRIGEKNNIQIVSSTKTILDRVTKEKHKIKNVALYGGVDFQYDNTSRGSLQNKLAEVLTDSLRNGFSYLNGTQIEIDTIGKMLAYNDIKYNVFSSTFATEQTFRNMDGNSPTIVHLATHGYYYTPRNAPNYLKQFTPYSITDSSMLYSGLLLAGANNNNDVSPYNFHNDGVISAEEISWMDFSNTELVILSACMSGWGFTNHDEWGGLIKAFKSAGVRYVMASLWNVPDIPTAKLMAFFYKYLISGEEIHNALLFAQQEMAKEYPDPYYWAPFIIVE